MNTTLASRRTNRTSATVRFCSASGLWSFGLAQLQSLALSPAQKRRRNTSIHAALPWGSAVIFLLAVGLASAQNTAPPAPIGGPRTSGQLPTRPGHQRDPVSASLSNTFVEGRNFHALRAASLQEVADADRMSRDYDARFGPNTLKTPRIGFLRTTRKITPTATGGGYWMDLPEGGKLWMAAIRSPDALGLRIHFTQFDAGDHRLRLYSRAQGQVVERGSYAGRGPNRSGEFWSASLPGDTVFLEMEGGGSREPVFEVEEVIHFDQPIFGVAPTVGPVQPIIGCHIDVACQSGLSAAAVDASVMLGSVIYYNGTTTRAGIAKYCSGTMLRDLDDATEVPYLVTAFHCLSTQAEADSLEVVFRYQRNMCGGTLLPLFSLPFSVGAQLLQWNPTDGGNDMAFFRLNPIQQLAPTDPPLLFAEWSTGNGLTAPSYGIHHPGGGNYYVPGSVPDPGDPSGHAKRVTVYEPTDYVLCPTIEDGDDGDYFLANPLAGGIQGGSSGSGLFDFNGRFLGQLYGSCGPGIDDAGNCADEDGWRAVYGKFWVSLDIAGVRRWMDIGGTINVDRAYNGTELGTPIQPFNTVIEGYNLAWDGARLKIRSGNYPETLTLSKQLTILAEGGPVTIGQ